MSLRHLSLLLLVFLHDMKVVVFLCFAARHTFCFYGCVAGEHYASGCASE
uniref:Putative secreted salivary protein n=1 Tax=Ixodes scapularis TaxID=6945 RepID=Q4PN33_IXOSC|nr:putative secreted salivary protein [Ixodes scapularis]